jgi:hypothetical protein
MKPGTNPITPIMESIFGFTDSIFIKNASVETINNLIFECKEKYHVTLLHKNRFINTIIFDKKIDSLHGQAIQQINLF